MKIFYTEGRRVPILSLKKEETGQYKLNRSKQVLKITLLFFFMSIWASVASTYSQSAATIKLKVSNVTIADVLKEIEKQSDYSFVYNVNDNYLTEKVSVTVTNKTITETLNSIFSGKEIGYKITNHHISLYKKEAVKQQGNKGKVTGVIVDVAGIPVIGANVSVKGTTNGTITDIDGNFSLDATSNDILVISYIGYKGQEISLNGKTSLNIILKEDTQALDEVVVVAYGTQKKVNLTAAVESVDTKMLENRPVKTATQMLEGVVPNLNITTSSGAPDAKSSLNVRGFTGLGLNSDGKVVTQSGGPLVLVDGVEMELDLVNPSDIENISVLKDAAASAIYGSRAPYGVILVTTKSGAKGKKVSINYTGNYQINQPSMMPHSATSVDFANYLNNAHRNSLIEGPYSKESIQRMQDYMDGKITDNNIVMPNGRWGEHWDANANTDYMGFAFKNYSQNTTHDLSLSGGTEKTTYYAGLGYSFREGIYNTELDTYNRYSGIVKLNTEITNWLSFNFNSRYTRSETVRPNYKDSASGSASDGAFWTNLGYFPNIPIFNPDNSYHRLSAMPVLEGKGGKINEKLDDYWLSVGAEVKPFAGLVVKGNFSWNMQSSTFDRTTLRFFIDEPNGEVLQSSRSANLDKLYKEAVKSNYYTFDITANYSKSVGKHDFSLLVGMQQELKQYNNMSGSVTGLYSQSIPSFSTSWGDNMSLNDEIGHWATRGYFFRASYNYDSRYLLDVNGRYDAASKYPRDTRWAFFPSVSAGWNIAREKFWPLEAISTLKVTGSFGKSGDQGGGNYLYIPTMGTKNMGNVVINGERPPYVSMPGIVAPDITWAKPQTIGFGGELAALNNRLRAEYYWYQRTTYDQLGPADKLPEVLGINPPQTNNAVTETRGWELSVSWRDKAFNIAGSPLNYEARFILSDYIGYVVQFQDNVAGARSAWTPGQVFGEVLGYKGDLARDKGALINTVLPGSGWYYPGDMMYQDLNGDGRIDNGVGGTWYSMGDLAKLGYNYPRYKYALNLSLNWKNFDCSIFLDGVGKEVRYVNNFSTFGQTGSWSSRYMFDLHSELDYWSMNSQDAFFPRIYQGEKNFSSANDRYLLDLAHLRIKNLNVGYTIPSDITRKIGLSRLAFNFSIENLGMIYYNSWLKMDPQMLRQNGNGYPIQRTFSMGVKIGI